MKNYKEIEDSGEKVADEWQEVDKEERQNKKEVDEEEELDMENRDDGASGEEKGEGDQPCFLCQKQKQKQRQLTSEQLGQLKQIYGFPDHLFQTLSSEPPFMCIPCRLQLHNVVSGKTQLSALPALTVSLQPSRIPLAKPKYKKKKELLKMRSMTAVNRTFKTERPEVAELLEYVKEICREYEYDCVEVGFFMLHKFLSSAMKHKLASQVKCLYTNRTLCTMSPRKSIANKLHDGRSHRSHRKLALFLKQFTGRAIFASRRDEDRFVEQLQPRSYSYKLFSTSDDPRCIEPFKQVHGVQRPKEPNLLGMSTEEADGAIEEHRCLLKKYRCDLATPTFDENYLNPHCESPTTNTLVVLEEYDRLLAAHLHQLAPQLLEKIREINSAGSEKMIPRGRVRAKVVVVDGSDGFADLRIISSKESRELSSHGITCDFTVISISMEHQVAEEGDFEVRHNKARAEGKDEEEELELSQAFSQSSISDGSSFIATQDSVSTSRGGETAPNDEGDERDEEDDGFSLIFDETKPNSSFVSRPIFR